MSQGSEEFLKIHTERVTFIYSKQNYIPMYGSMLNQSAVINKNNKNIIMFY